MRCCFSAAVEVAICLHLLSHSITCTLKRARTSTVGNSVSIRRSEAFLIHSSGGSSQDKNKRLILLLPLREGEEFNLQVPEDEERHVR